MRKLTFINADNDRIEISRGSDYKLLNFSGVGNTAPLPQQTRGFKQDGITHLGNLLEPRVLDLGVEINNYDKVLVNNMRSYLMQVFNPKLGLGEIIYSNGFNTYRIEAYVYDFLEMVEMPYNTENVQGFSLGLCCPNPAWKSYERYSRKLVGFIGGLTLPFTLPFKLAEQGSTIEIDYNGTLEAPLLIEFRGGADRPKIIKHETNEYIEVNVQLAENEKLFIDTTWNDINIYTKDETGIEHPAINYINPLSKYFRLTKGKNTISFSASSGKPEVYLYWYELFSGV